MDPGIGDQLDPHRGQPVLARGAAPDQATGAVLAIHGRGGSAGDILGLVDELADGRLALLAPQASGSSWYPLSFLAPLEDNEPHLSSALASLERLVERLDQRGIPSSSVLIVGFSQGACLTLEYVARHPRRFGGVAALTGGLLGPRGRDWSALAGDLEGTPTLLAAGDPDPYVPWWRVEESAKVLERLGAETTLCRYPGLGHTVSDEEMERLRALAAALPSAAR